jgi:hypothetical protein
MALPYHMTAGSTEHGPATMFRTGLTQFKDLPASFIDAFNNNVRTPYRVFDPTGEVLIDREGRFESSLYTSLPDRTPLKYRLTEPKKNEEKKIAAEEKKRIEDMINKAMAPERKKKDAEIKQLKEEVRKLRESLKTDDESMTDVVSTLISDPETKAEALKVLKEGEKLKDEAVINVLKDKIDVKKSESEEFLITKPGDISPVKLNSVFDKLGFKGLKGAKRAVKIKIAQKLEDETSIPIAGLVSLSKSKLPASAIEFVGRFNDGMAKVIGDKKVITSSMFDKYVKRGKI